MESAKNEQEALSPLQRSQPTRGAAARIPRGERTRERILEEAVRCILEEGYAAVTAKHVSQRAGVSWGVVQYHFGDRHGLLMEVVGEAYRRFEEQVSSAQVRSDAGLSARVETIVDVAWAAYSSPISRASIEVLVATRASRREGTNDQLRRMGAVLQDLSTRILDGGDPAETAVIADILLAALRGFTLTQMLGADEVDFGRYRPLIVDMVLRALRRRPQRLLNKA